MSVNQRYFNWLYNIMNDEGDISYRKLFKVLDDIPFIYSIERDSNRACDGLGLRRRFANRTMYNGIVKEGYPCSVLEMIIALAIRCEESIMDDPRYGDRTRQWFWQMLNSLGLSAMCDEKFDEEKTRYIIDRFLDRAYQPNGKGGLFTIKHCKEDLRNIEIWVQLCWYLEKFEGS